MIGRQLNIKLNLLMNLLIQFTKLINLLKNGSDSV